MTTDKDWHLKYFRCPYCGTKGGHEQTVSKTVGWFRIQKIYSNVLILKCKKCSRTCRVKMIGSVLQWEDMSPEERSVFKDKQFKAFNKLKDKTK